MKFNERLLEFRKKKGWSQEELGYKLDVSRQTISKWESGQTKPELDKLRNLAKIFEITVDELINEEDENNIGQKGNLKDDKITKKKNSKLKNVIIYLLIVSILFYVVLVVYRYGIILKINQCFMNVLIESNYNYYVEKRTFGCNYNFGKNMTREEYFYYTNIWNPETAEENEIKRLKINKYSENNLLNPSEVVFIDNFLWDINEKNEITEFSNINKTYKKINDYEYLSVPQVIRTEYESIFNTLDDSRDWINCLRYALDLRISIAYVDDGYYMSNEKTNAPKQENHCYIQASDNRIIFEKIVYEEEMKANYSGIRYKLRLGTTEAEDVSFPDMTEYTLVEE